MSQSSEFSAQVSFLSAWFHSGLNWVEFFSQARLDFGALHVNFMLQKN